MAGSLGRGDSDSLLMAQPAGSYLIRTSSKDACLVLSFSHVDESGALRIKNCLIHNLGARGYGLVPDPKDEDVYPTVSALLATSASRLVAAVRKANRCVAVRAAECLTACRRYCRLCLTSPTCVLTKPRQPLQRLQVRPLQHQSVPPP